MTDGKTIKVQFWDPFLRITYIFATTSSTYLNLFTLCFVFLNFNHSLFLSIFCSKMYENVQLNCRNKINLKLFLHIWQIYLFLIVKWMRIKQAYGDIFKNIVNLIIQQWILLHRILIEIMPKSLICYIV